MIYICVSLKKTLVKLTFNLRWFTFSYIFTCTGKYGFLHMFSLATNIEPLLIPTRITWECEGQTFD